MSICSVHIVMYMEIYSFQLDTQRVQDVLTPKIRASGDFNEEQQKHKKVKIIAQYGVIPILYV